MSPDWIRCHEWACTAMLGQLYAAFQGKWVFVAALLLMLVWLIVMPRRFVGHTGQRLPWWRNIRIWAIVICVAQIWVYWRFG